MLAPHSFPASLDVLRCLAASRCLLGDRARAWGLTQACRHSAAAAHAAVAEASAPASEAQQEARPQQQPPQQEPNGAQHAHRQQPPAAQHPPSSQQQAQQLSAAQAGAAMERKPLAPPGYSRTFYKRQLPSPPAIEFASDRGERAGGRRGRGQRHGAAGRHGPGCGSAHAARAPGMPRPSAHATALCSPAHVAGGRAAAAASSPCLLTSLPPS